MTAPTAYKAVVSSRGDTPKRNRSSLKLEEDRSADAALPLAYAVLLPVAFVSQVFFPAPTEAAWLHHLSSFLPVAPFANAMEAAFSPVPHGLTVGQLSVLLTWAAVGFVFALLDYRFEPTTRTTVPPMSKQTSTSDRWRYRQDEGPTVAHRAPNDKSWASPANDRGDFDFAMNKPSSSMRPQRLPHRLVLFALCAVLFLTFLDMKIVSVALAVFPRV